MISYIPYGIKSLGFLTVEHFAFGVFGEFFLLFWILVMMKDVANCVFEDGFLCIRSFFKMIIRWLLERKQGK